MITTNDKDWGGARKNSGRKKMIVPPGARKRVTSPLTDEAWEKVKTYIIKLNFNPRSHEGSDLCSRV